MDCEDTKFKRRRHRRSDLSITYHCAVCGDKTNCYNFGVPACEGCKGFYRRHMTRVGKMVCIKDGNCEINMETRKTCLACRMRKCCEVGMQRDPLTKDPVTKPRRRKLKAPNEKLRPGRKPGSKLHPKEPKPCTSVSTKQLENASSSKQLEETMATNATSDQLPSVTVEKPSSAEITNELDKNNVFQELASPSSSSVQHNYSNIRNKDERQLTSGTENSVLAHTYSFSNPSSVCTYVSQVAGSPRSVSSVPPKKRKLVMDGSEGSPFPSRNDSGVWGSSYAQLSTKSDAESNLPVYDSSCSAVQCNYVSSNYTCPSPASSCSTGCSNKLVHRVHQITQSTSDQQQSVVDNGSVGEDQRSAFHRFTRPSEVAVKRTENSDMVHVHDLYADSLHEIPDAVYEQILSDCMTLATMMRAAWTRDELGSTLYDEPRIPDARYQSRYMESRIHRMVFALKRSRCFSPLSDSEKLLVIKCSMPSVMMALEAYCSTESGDCCIERFDDGRVIERCVSDVLATFDHYGVDLRQLFSLSLILNRNLYRYPLLADLPIVISILVILVSFQSCAEEKEVAPLLSPTPDHVPKEVTSSPRSMFKSKVASIRREHASFLRRFLVQRVGSGAKESDMWRFCVARLNELMEISKLCRSTAVDFYKHQPAMIETILPVMEEVMGRMVGSGNSH